MYHAEYHYVLNTVVSITVSWSRATLPAVRIILEDCCAECFWLLVRTGERLVSLIAVLDRNAVFDTLDHFITPKGEL